MEKKIGFHVASHILIIMSSTMVKVWHTTNRWEKRELRFVAKCWGCEQQSGGVEGESDEENLEKFVKVFQQVHSHMFDAVLSSKKN